MRSPRITESLIQALASGAVRVPALTESVSKTEGVSVQAVYQALRKLREEETVTIHNKYASLSGSWIQKELDRFAFMANAYASSEYIEELRSGSAKKHIFHFKTLKELDLFWSHAYILLAEQIDPSYPTYSVMPHDWFPYARESTDTYWAKRHIENKRSSRVVLTHASTLDRAVIRERQKTLGSLFEFVLNENPLKQRNTEYYNSVAEYVFKADFDPKIAERLDDFIATEKKLPLTAGARKKIDEITSMKGVFTLTIIRSPEKASRIEQKVRRYFDFS